MLRLAIQTQKTVTHVDIKNHLPVQLIMYKECQNEVIIFLILNI